MGYIKQSVWKRRMRRDRSKTLKIIAENKKGYFTKAAADAAMEILIERKYRG